MNFSRKSGNHSSSASRKATKSKLAAAIPVFLAEDGLNLQVRCSMGLATYPEDAKSSHEIIRQADEMMYMVKNSSRDNIAVAQQGVLK